MRLRLFLAFALIITVTAVVFGYSVLTNTRAAITTFAQKGGFVGADRVVTELETYYQTNGSWSGVVEAIEQVGHGSGSGQGNRFGGGESTGQGMMTNFSLADAAGNLIINQNATLTSPLPSTVLDNAIQLHYGGQVIGYLIPANSIYALSDLISSDLTTVLSESLLPTTVIAGGIALVLALILAYVLLRPINQLNHAASQLAQGDLSQRVRVGGNDEIGHLAKTFNHMADSLQRAEQSRQAMTADIAHELRTPLSVQRANLEAMQDGIYPLTVENLTPILQQNQMLTQLVEDLRTLALADAESLSLDVHSHDIIALLQQIESNFQSQFSSHGITLALDLPASAPALEIDARRITQVINNLLQNALRHTPEGGQVKISLRVGKEVSIAVRDSGEGIPPESLALIFDRFYRADQSRARDKGGSGLGLAIARQLAEAHGGDLTAANAPEGGAIFTLVLPLNIKKSR